MTMSLSFKPLGRAAGVLLAVTTVALGAACQRTSAVAPTTVSDPVERGRYLVEIMACGDCHTPWKLGADGPEPDQARALSGHPEAFELGAPPALREGWGWAGAGSNTAFAGPWGISYAANLTPDEETGLGFWSEEMFLQALRSGKHFGGGRPINPPMPWPAYSHATDEDLKALFAYLRTVKPIVNHVPEWHSPQG
jgi:mono/diheme cytochrome c family protein